MTTLLRSTRSRLAAAGVAAVVAAPLVLAGPAFAGNQMPNPVTGVATCNTTTGLHEVTWTVENTVGEVVDIDSSVLSGAATGNPDFTPNPIPIDESATAEGTIAGSAVGAVVLTVETSWVDGEFPMDASSSFTLNLTACVQSTTTTTSTSTTTTTAPTTTTTAPPAVVPVVVTPVFTG
jgi:hypothetical protein